MVTANKFHAIGLDAQFDHNIFNKRQLEKDTSEQQIPQLHKAEKALADI
jgi:hypothetical protein